MKITIEHFKDVFIDCKTELSGFNVLPKNKEEYINKLYQMYLYGRKNREDEILSNVKNLILK